MGFEWSYCVNSLYALASGLAEPNEIIQLKDHHRSCADIIEFGNREFYSGKLRVATDYSRLNSPNSISLGVRWIHVGGHTIRPSTGGAYNKEKAMAIVQELNRLVVRNDYRGSVGVVTPFRAQEEHIRAEIDKNPAIKKYLYTNNDFLVDTVHKFQGDERDMILFSPVISAGAQPGAISFLNHTGNLFNVAITRARAVLVVVGNRDYCECCGVSYMEHFVKYISEKHGQEERKGDQAGQKLLSREYPKIADAGWISEWEKLLYTALFDVDIFTEP